MKPGIGAGLMGTVAVLCTTWATAGEIPPPRQAELRQLLTQDCGSCHGLTLKGGLGPALTPEALAGKSPASLRATILHGRPGTPMAPWSPFLTDVEAGWLVEQLLNGTAHARAR